MIYRIVFVFLFFQISFRSNAILTTLYVINLQASTMTLGIIVALVSLFPMTFAVYAGRISDRVGYRMPLVFGSFGVSGALLLPFIFRDTLPILFISQSLFGLASIFLLVNVQNFVGRISTLDNRSNNFATYSLGVSIASLLGPLLTGFSIDHLGYSSTYLVLAIMAAVPGILITLNIFAPPEPEIKQKEVESNNIKYLLSLRALQKTYIMSAVILMGVGIYELFLPIYGNSIGLTASEIGIILSINASAYFLVRLLMPFLMNKFGDEIVFIGCLMISAVTFIFIPLFDSLLKLSIVSFILGIGLGCGQPLSILMAYNSSPRGKTGEVLGIRLMINKTVQFLVPIVFGSIGTLVGFFPIFWSNAILLFIGGIISVADRKGMTKG